MMPYGVLNSVSSQAGVTMFPIGRYWCIELCLRWMFPQHRSLSVNRRAI